MVRKFGLVRNHPARRGEVSVGTRGGNQLKFSLKFNFTVHLMPQSSEVPRGVAWGVVWGVAWGVVCIYY